MKLLLPVAALLYLLWAGFAPTLSAGDMPYEARILGLDRQPAAGRPIFFFKPTGHE